MTSIMVANIIFDHLEQLLFSKHCSKLLYLENAVKFSSQEHTRPPRIQEEKSGFDSRFPKSGYDLNRKQLPEQYLTSRKLREWPQTWPFYPLLEGEIIKNGILVLRVSTKFLTKIFVGGPSDTYWAPIPMVHIVTPMGHLKWSIKITVFSTIKAQTVLSYACELHFNHKIRY